MVCRDELAVTQDDRALERVVQLAHIAWPVVAHQRRSCVRRQTRVRTSARSLELPKECVGQQRDVATTLAQRRDADVEDLEPIKQVLSKAPVRDRPPQVAVARGDDTDVSLGETRTAEPPELPLLQYPEKLRLGHRTHLTYFVEEQHACRGQFDLARLGLLGAGERAAFVAEQL